MKEIVLDGKLMSSREAAHAYLKAALELPAYYGANLDALYDLLTEKRRQELTVTLINGDMLRDALGDYGEGIVSCFADAFTKKGGAVFREE